MRQFRVAVPEGIEHMGLRARAVHKTGNWSILTELFNAFNTLHRTAVLAEMATYLPVPTPFVVSCHGEKPADDYFGWIRGGT